MTNDNQPACTTCRFREADPQHIGWGGCKRYPPTILPGIENATMQFIPYVGPSDWCGEYLPVERMLS